MGRKEDWHKSFLEFFSFYKFFFIRLLSLFFHERKSSYNDLLSNHFPVVNFRHPVITGVVFWLWRAHLLSTMTKAPAKPPKFMFCFPTGVNTQPSPLFRFCSLKLSGGKAHHYYVTETVQSNHSWTLGLSELSGREKVSKLLPLFAKLDFCGVVPVIIRKYLDDAMCL